MFRETVFTAAIAGTIAALALTILQMMWVTPIILQAETYERAPMSHQVHVDEHAATTTVRKHYQGSEEWRPQNGWQRTAFTFAANLLTGFGYAFLLIAVYLLWRQPSNAVHGAICGLGGFVCCFVAPAMGLPPELPGTPAAELGLRQSWWILVAASSAAGLLLYFSRLARSTLGWVPPWSIRALGVTLFIVPHFIAAPHLPMAISPAPEELHNRFLVATTLSNAIFWLLLGWASSIAFNKLMPLQDDLSS
jgi:cobalt transporter subunit CbtA